MSRCTASGPGRTALRGRVWRGMGRPCSARHFSRRWGRPAAPCCSRDRRWPRHGPARVSVLGLAAASPSLAALQGAAPVNAPANLRRRRERRHFARTGQRHARCGARRSGLAGCLGPRSTGATARWPWRPADTGGARTGRRPATQPRASGAVECGVRSTRVGGGGGAITGASAAGALPAARTVECLVPQPLTGRPAGPGLPRPQPPHLPRWEVMGPAGPAFPGAAETEALA